MRLRRTMFKLGRQLATRTLRRLCRGTVRRLPGASRSGPALAEALSAFARAIRCHRRLARLAPEFFDAAVVDRAARERAARQCWRASWEPALRSVYGPPDPARPVGPSDDRPRLPGSRTRLAVDRLRAEWDCWMTLGRRALVRYQERRPHALPGFGQVARLLEVASAFGRLATGQDSPHYGQPEPDWLAQAEADLLRAYGAPLDGEVPATG